MNYDVFKAIPPHFDNHDAELDYRLDLLSLIYTYCDFVTVIKSGTTRFYFKDYRKVIVIQDFAKARALKLGFQTLVDGGFELFVNLNDYFIKMNNLCNRRGLRKSATYLESSV